MLALVQKVQNYDFFLPKVFQKEILTEFFSHRLIFCNRNAISTVQSRKILVTENEVVKDVCFLAITVSFAEAYLEPSRTSMTNF